MLWLVVSLVPYACSITGLLSPKHERSPRDIRAGLGLLSVLTQWCLLLGSDEKRIRGLTYGRGELNARRSSA